MAMLEINDLHVNYGMIAALKGISFEVNEGEVISLIGANGAGKTTLFRLILDLLQADHGNVTINDIDVSQSEDWKLTKARLSVL